MFKQEPGDIVFCRTAYVEHWITKILNGQRYCNTRFTKGDVAHPPLRPITCPIPACGSKYGLAGSLYTHLLDEHHGLSDGAVDAIINDVKSESSSFTKSQANTIESYLKERVARREKHKAQRKAAGKKRKGTNGNSKEAAHVSDTAEVGSTSALQ